MGALNHRATPCVALERPFGPFKMPGTGPFDYSGFFGDLSLMNWFALD
jgi:hypothetical protein